MAVPKGIPHPQIGVPTVTYSPEPATWTRVDDTAFETTVFDPAPMIPLVPGLAADIAQEGLRAPGSSVEGSLRPAPVMAPQVWRRI